MAEDKTSIVVPTTGIVDDQPNRASDVAAALTYIQTQLRKGLASVNAADTQVGYLSEKITANNGLQSAVVGDSTLNLSLVTDLQLFNDNYVQPGGQVALGSIATSAAAAGTPIVADGAGGAKLGGSGSVANTDVTITAGEALSARDFVAVNPTDGKAYKVDADLLTGNGAINHGRGFVVDASIAADATGTMRTYGTMAGFSGLTAWEPYYASSTPGAIDQSVVTPPTGGRVYAQVCAATSATEILIHRYPVFFVKRGSAIADNASIAIDHMLDTFRIIRYAYTMTNFVQNTTGNSATTTTWGSNVIDIAYTDNDTTTFTNRTGSSVTFDAIVMIE